MRLRRRWVRFLSGGKGLASLVLWEQKTFGSTGPWLCVPAGERAVVATAYHEQVCRSLYPALTVSLGGELLMAPPLCPAGYR